MHVIKEVKPTDEGLYTCIAGNFIGQATASAYLEVNSGPSLSAKGPIAFVLPLLLLSAAWSRLTTSTATR